MTIGRAVLAAWAAQHGIAVHGRDELPPLESAASPRGDFGRWLERAPAFVLEPHDEAQLVSCMRLLRDVRMPYKLRGAAHSSGGQTLIDGGAVIDLRGLAMVVSDDPEREEITVGGGVTWLALVEHLRPQGRRPLALTTSFRATLAGTVGVGGFGDTSHLYGMVTAGVRGMTLITPDGERHVVGPGDDLFDYTLAGRGQLGAVASVTLRTLRRPFDLSLRSLIWSSLADYVRDALIIAQLRLFEFLRARLMWQGEGWEVHGMVGHFSAGSDTPVEIDALSPAAVSALGSLSLAERLLDEQGHEWSTSCPAVEISLPLPVGVDVWDRLAEGLAAAGLMPYLGHGVTVMLVPRQAPPLVPLPDTAYSLVLAVRPVVPLAEAAEVAAKMRAFAAGALAAGARLYLMSVEPDRALIRQQFGERWSRWAALRRSVDPDGLCNPGLLDG